MHHSLKHGFLAALMTVLLATAPFAWSSPYDDAVAAQDRGDVASAFSTFKTLAGQGDANSQFRLSLLYANGQGVKADARQSLFWLRQAAHQGHALAQSNLGVAYARGRGVAPDAVKAYVWFSLGASSGSTEAATNRDMTERRMSPQQRAQAKALLQTCQQGHPGACD